MRVLVEALSEGGIAPTAEAARHVEKMGARTVGRSIRLRLRRLPEQAGRLARALAVLEQGDLFQAARLAGLEEVEAAEAAELLMTAGILESGRPLTFIHPIVRSGIYSDLTSGGARTRPPRCRATARRATGRERAGRQAPAGQRARRPMAGSSSGLSRPRARRESRALPSRRPSSCAERSLNHRRRATGRHCCWTSEWPRLASGSPSWPEHLQRAVDSAPNVVAAAEAAMVLGLALEPRSALCGGGRGSRSCSVGARFPPLRARAPARGRGSRRRDERPRHRTLGGPPP